MSFIGMIGGGTVIPIEDCEGEHPKSWLGIDEASSSISTTDVEWEGRHSVPQQRRQQGPRRQSDCPLIAASTVGCRV